MADLAEQDKTLKLLETLLERHKSSEKIQADLLKEVSALVDLLQVRQQPDSLGVCKTCGRASWPTPLVHSILIAWTCIVFSMAAVMRVTWGGPISSSIQSNLIWLVLIVVGIPIVFAITLLRAASSSLEA